MNYSDRAYVYFIWVWMGGYLFLKIGQSTNLQIRIKQYSLPEQPFRVDRFVCDNVHEAVRFERFAQESLNKYHTRGDWFRAHTPSAKCLKDDYVFLINEIRETFSDSGREFDYQIYEYDIPEGQMVRQSFTENRVKRVGYYEALRLLDESFQSKSKRAVTPPAT